MYDLIAIDFDGTLLAPDGKVSAATKRAVRRAVEAGFEIVFATGRNWYESMEVLEDVEHHATAVFVGGAITVDLEKREVIDRRTMDADAVVQVCKLFEAHDLAPLVLQDRELGGVDFYHGQQAIPEAVRDWHQRHQLIVREVQDLSELNHAHTLRVSTLGPRPAVAAAQREIDERYADRVFAYQVDLANYGVRLLEAFGPGVNKWEAIKRVAATHDIGPSRIVAIGDDMNDLQMIEGAGLGVAMGNARDPIKAVADRIIGPSADDGLAAFLTELVEER